MTRTTLALCLAMSFAGGVEAAAQPATTAQADSITRVTLGQSAVPLYGPWKFTVGDSPIDPKTGKPLWAEPDFDDSSWETVNLTPKSGALDPIGGLSGYVTGWTAKGHPGYFGYAWYRIRVQVITQPLAQTSQARPGARPGGGLALAGPANVDDAYQVFDNGKFVGSFGDFSGSKPEIYNAKPKMFPLAPPGNLGTVTAPNGTAQDRTKSDQPAFGQPAFGQPRPDPAATAGSTRVLAFRLWMEPYTLANEPDSGGMHSAPVLGEAGAVAAGYQMRWLELIRAYASITAQGLVFGLLAVVAFSLVLFDRSDRVYLWMGALFLLIAVSSFLVVIGAWTELQSFPVNNLLVEGLAVPLMFAAWVMVWRVWFGQQRPPWLPRLTAALALLLMVSNILADEVFFGLIPHAVAHHFATVSLVLRLLFFALLLWVVIEGIRHQGVEGWLVLPVVVLRGIHAFTIQLNVLHIRMVWFPFGAQVTLGTFASMLAAVVIALLLVRRLLQSVKRQRLMALDVKQAQEVQQVILPEARMVLPGLPGLAGLTIENEYRPARQVGGDFFQIIPHKTDGSLLIVAGDVTGKGLKAGMLVALLVGAIRTAAGFDPDPLAVLRELNQRLVGRADAQATCLALRIAADGAATLANAGHMAPYLNGEPLPMEGALPLGMIEGAEFSVMHFQLQPHDQLMLMSDGVAEATDADGKLFGFERVNEMLRKANSIADIANAAQSFGQEDDISLILVTRTPALELVTA